MTPLKEASQARFLGWKENDSEQSCTGRSDTCSGFIEYTRRSTHRHQPNLRDRGFVRRNFSSFYISLLFADCFASWKMTIWCCLQTVLFIFNERVLGSRSRNNYASGHRDVQINQGKRLYTGKPFLSSDNLCRVCAFFKIIHGYITFSRVFCFRRIYIFIFNLVQMFIVWTCCKWTNTYLNCNFNWGCSGQKPWFSFPLVLQNQYFTQSNHGSTVGVIGLINDWECLDDFSNGFFTE